MIIRFEESIIRMMNAIYFSNIPSTQLRLIRVEGIAVDPNQQTVYFPSTGYPLIIWHTETQTLSVVSDTDDYAAGD